jgi:RND family efflux transporter MFP subunit
MRPHTSVAVLLLALLAAACDGGPTENAQAQGAAQGPAPVTVAKPLVERLTEFDEFTGRFEPVEVVDIRARVSGYLDSIHFEDGQIVEPGQLLFVIDPRPYEAVVASRKADVAAAESQVRLALIEEARTRRLVRTNAQAQAQLDQRVAERQSREASLALAGAQLDHAELDLGFTRVSAPFRGRISDRRFDVGNLIDASSLLTTIVRLDPIYLTFDMSESDHLAYTRAVAKGELPSTRDNKTPVQAHLVDEEDWLHHGTMSFVDNVVDRGTGTIRGRAVFPNPNLLVTPGQFGRIRIPGSPEYDAILIPDAAIVTDQSRKQVLVVGADNKVVPTVIRPGPSRPGGLRIVRRGLSPDNRIVIQGLLQARAGSEVAPTEGKIEPLPAPAATPAI